MSVSHICLSFPSRGDLFFSQILSFLLLSRSIILRSFSSSLYVKIALSDGYLNGFSSGSIEPFLRGEKNERSMDAAFDPILLIALEPATLILI